MSDGETPKVYTGTLDQVRFDGHNANHGTALGRYVIEKSLREAGFGRPVLWPTAT